jgi:hypothetical protein
VQKRQIPADTPESGDLGRRAFSDTYTGSLKRHPGTIFDVWSSRGNRAAVQQHEIND